MKNPTGPIRNRTRDPRLVAQPPTHVDIIPYYILHEYAYVRDQLFVRYAVTDNTPNVRNLTY